MNFESRGIHSFFDPSKIPARGEDSRPEVEQVVARKNSESSFRASILLCLLRNQLGWRELSRDDRSGKSGELWKSSQACQRLKRVSVSSGIVGGCLEENVVSTTVF